MFSFLLFNIACSFLKGGSISPEINERLSHVGRAFLYAFSPYTQNQNIHIAPFPGSSTLKDPSPGRSPLFLKNSSIKARRHLISPPVWGESSISPRCSECSSPVNYLVPRLDNRRLLFNLRVMGQVRISGGATFKLRL